MNMKKKAVIPAILIAVMWSMAADRPAESSTAAGGQPGMMFSYGAGARGLGMGRAYAGIADDATASIWNPAGLTQLDRTEIVALHTILFEDTGYEFVSCAYPTLDYGTLGLSILYLHTSGFEVTTAETVGVEQGAEFTAGKLGIIGSYAYPVWTDRLNIGANIKYYSNTVYNDTSGFLIWDIGVMSWPMKHLRVGLNLQNLLSFTVKGDTEDKIPVVIRFGSSYQFLNDQLAVAFDLDTQGTRMRANYYLGAEYRIFNPLRKLPYQIALRIGHNYEETITFGFGARYLDYSLDYAFGSYEQGSSHRFSASVKFGGSLVEAREQKLQEERLAQHGKADEFYKSAEDDGKNGLYASASDKLAKALDYDPEYTEAKRLKEKMDMVSSFLPKVTGDDQNARLSKKAVAQLMDDDAETAAKILEYLLQRDPYNPENDKLIRLGKTMSQKYNVDFKPSPSPVGMSYVESLLYEALGYFYEGRYNKVIELCEKVLEVEPNNIIALMRLGSGHYAIGNKVKARELWRKAFILDPKRTDLEKFIQKVEKEIKENK